MGHSAPQNVTARTCARSFVDGQFATTARVVIKLSLSHERLVDAGESACVMSLGSSGGQLQGGPQQPRPRAQALAAATACSEAGGAPKAPRAETRGAATSERFDVGRTVPNTGRKEPMFGRTKPNPNLVESTSMWVERAHSALADP